MELEDFSKNLWNGGKERFWTCEIDKNRRYYVFKGELVVSYSDQRASTF